MTPRFGLLTDAPVSVHLVGARVIDPSDGSDAVRDIVIRDGRIDTDGAGLERIDANGWVVSPGFCDLHVHLREPGGGGAETIASGTRAAARGGFTTVCAMPNTDPAIDTPEAVAALGVDAACRVRAIGAVSRGRGGRELADLAGMARAGAVGFSDDGTTVPHDLAGSAVAAIAALDLPLLEHAEDPELAAGGVMRAGPTATRLGLPGWPPRAEASIIERDLELAAASGTRVHVTHLSTREGLDAVRRAKSRGQRVTCDVTPHHLTLSDTWVAGSRRFAWEESEAQPAPAYDGRCRVNPPLASREDALALLEGVADGSIDAIATDHAPHLPDRKLVPFEAAAPGLIGLETALSLGLAAVDAGRLSLPALIRALTTGPASIIGEHRGLRPGDPADLVAFEPTARWRVIAEALASASANTPLLGMELPGEVRLTVAGGRLTYRA